jgi:hypothetical protein
MFEKCNKGHAPKRAKPDTRCEAFETRRGWRGCRLAVTEGKKPFLGKNQYQGKVRTAWTIKREGKESEVLKLCRFLQSTNS